MGLLTFTIAFIAAAALCSAQQSTESTTPTQVNASATRSSAENTTDILTTSSESSGNRTTTRRPTLENPTLRCKNGGYQTIGMLFARDPCYMTCSPSWYQAIVGAAAVTYLAPDGSNCHRFTWWFTTFVGKCQNGRCV